MKKFQRTKSFIAMFVTVVLSVTVFPFATYANDVETLTVIDSVFDLSEEQRLIDELGIPVQTAVDVMLQKADTLYAQQNYVEAAEAYAIYAKNANWLANIISKTCRPYYKASYDDRKNFSYTTLLNLKLSDLESLSNRYKSSRNVAMLREGLCYYYSGNYTSSLPLLIKALDILDISQTAEWKEAIIAVLNIVGVTGINLQ